MINCNTISFFNNENNLFKGSCHLNIFMQSRIIAFSVRKSILQVLGALALLHEKARKNI
jgi:hypothetical protein